MEHFPSLVQEHDEVLILNRDGVVMAKTALFSDEIAKALFRIFLDCCQFMKQGNASGFRRLTSISFHNLFSKASKDGTERCDRRPRKHLHNKSKDSLERI